MLQEDALEILKEGYNVFLTGCAGAGKTYLLNKYINFLRKEKISVGITASTGIAATHLEGVTIHSFVGMGILNDLNERDLKKILKKKYLEKNIRNIDVLIIDEISMLSANQLDIINAIIKAFRGNNEPFGGMQVILCGDFFQLPPINKDKNLYSAGRNFAYKSRAWKELDMRICYLTEQYRHKEEELNFILNAIRSNTVSDKVLDLLNKCKETKIQENKEVTKLYTHNFDVDHINNKKLSQISSKIERFYIKKEGSEKLADSLSRNLLVPEILELKKGAFVMFVKNNFEKGYVNGTLGKVVEFNNKMPVVKTISGKRIKVEEEKWSIIEDGEIKAEVRHLPLRLAWAITIHKSQGMTLDVAEIDLERSFDSGMGYVALSRVRSLNGLRLIGFNNKSLMVDKEVIKMDTEFKKLSKKDKKEFYIIHGTKDK